MKKIRKQFEKTEDICNKANISCQELARLISPYIHEDIRDDINVFDQHGDGLVLEFNCYNYTVESVIEAIEDGKSPIDLREDPCFLVSI